MNTVVRLVMALMVVLPLVGGAADNDSVLRPYKGMWFPIGEPGSGFVLDQEDDTLVVTFFTYDGEIPTWHLASGTLDADVFESTADIFRDGSCLGCTHELPTHSEGPPVRLEFVGRTTAWLTWDGGEAKPVRALPFASPFYLGFGPEGSHGMPGIFDLSGRWVFAGSDRQPFPLDPEFSRVTALDPGGFRWEESFESVPAGDAAWALGCAAFDAELPDSHWQCIMEERGSHRNRPFSVFWADHGPESMLGYTSSTLEHDAEAVRGTGLIRGFRLTGPVLDTEDTTGNADPDEVAQRAREAMDNKTPLYIDKGMWMVPGKPGSGMTIDWQNDVVVATFFSYRENGEPLWLQGSGIVKDSVVEFDLLEYSGGSCFNCDYREPQSLPEAPLGRLDFTSKTTAWLSIGESEPIPLRSLAFDSSAYREFGEPGPFGSPALYDLRGSWVFVDHLGDETFYREVTFTTPMSAGDGNTLGWRNADGTVTFRCDSKQSFASPQCRLLEYTGEKWRRLKSAHWADVGEDQIIGYEAPPLAGDDGITRGEHLIFGFRLTRHDPEQPESPPSR